MDEYDEVITDNLFYKDFQNKAKPLYSLAADNRWLICIPRKGTTNRSQHTLQQFETHVLKKVKEDDDSLYQTHNEKEVKVSGDFIITDKGFSNARKVKVLFEETFFNPQNESYHVLCIEQPLEGGAFKIAPQPVIPKLETLQNCIDFLWHGTGRKCRKKIDDVVDIFNSTYRRLETESIRHAVDAANAVFTKAMQTALKEPYLRRPADGSEPFMDSLKVAVETYVMYGLYRRTFKGICSFLANEDAGLNKITRNLADLHMKDLGIKQEICKNIPKGKKIISNLNRFSTPLEKLYVLKLTVTCVSKVQDPSKPITADDLLPVLVFLVVKSEIPNWLANLTYMYNFHFSKYKNDEFQFYLSSIEAAMEYIRTGKLNHLIGLTHVQRQNSIKKLFQRLDSTEKAQGPSPVEVLFDEIRNGNIENVRKMLTKGIAESKPLTEQLCHPLCSCDSCEKLLSSKRNDPTAVTVFSRDDKGSTVLHPAAEFDQEILLFELIKREAVVNAANYHGSTPLHLACLRGHNKSAMMLIHYGGSINATDNDGNTPLHLATVNGHEKVAEALMLVDSHHTQALELNAANDHGDTPLHIASRWGFTNLVSLLLEHGASVESKNNNKESPIDCAANLKVHELIVAARKEDPEIQNVVYIHKYEFSDGANSVFSGESVQSPYSPNLSPRTKRGIKEFESLLKVVEDGDLAMVKMKLGLSDNDEDETDAADVEREDEGHCHPLCQCNKCTGRQRTISESVVQQVNMADEDGVTCLHIASLRGYGRIVSLLLSQCGASANCRTRKSFKTPLHFACQYNHVECVSLLLAHGAKTESKDTEGNTPLHFCCRNGHISPAILLLQSNANVNTANKRGNTPLHESAIWNCSDLVTLLLYYGASIELKNKSNLTCLHYAQHNEVIEILRNVEAARDEASMAGKAQQHNHPSSKSSFRSSQVSLFSDDLATSNDAFEKAIDRDSIICERKEQSEFQSKEKLSFRNNQRRTSIANLFEAYEEDDKEKIEKLLEGIQKFDKKKKLRRASTIDKSEPSFDLHLIQMLSIQHFDISSLHHIDVRNNRSLTSTESELSHRKSETEGIAPNFNEIEPFEVSDKEMSEISSRNNETMSQTFLLGQSDPSEWSCDPNNDSSETANALKSTEMHMVGRNEFVTYFAEEIVSQSEGTSLPCDSASNGVHDNIYKSEEENAISAGELIENLSLDEDDDAILTRPPLQEGLSNTSINAEDLIKFECSNTLNESQTKDSVKVHGNNHIFLGDTEKVNFREASEEGRTSFVNEANVFGVEANCHIPEGDSFIDRDHQDKMTEFNATINCTNEKPKEAEEERHHSYDYATPVEFVRSEDKQNCEHGQTVS